MDTKIGILRGINVGGNRKILMHDLKLMFETLGVSILGLISKVEM